MRYISIPLIILYPFGMLVGLKFFGPRVLSFFFLGIIAFQIVTLKNDENKMTKLSLIFLAAALFIATQFTNQILLIKLYPVLVNFIFLGFFGYTLFFPPSMIERFARKLDRNLPDRAIKYTYNVTVIWCGFFIMNAAASAYTTFYTSTEIWTLYNGFITYILMGVLFIGEYIVRCRVIKSHQRG